MRILATSHWLVGIDHHSIGVRELG
jgi:hypothetical protein